MIITTPLCHARTAVKNRRSILYSVLSLLLLSVFSLSISAAQLYRYKNEQGVMVLTQTLPAQYANQGYEILNEKGRVIRVVPPALTPEQIAERDAALESARLAEIEKQKQDKIDEELRLLYSHPNDAVRVLERRLQDFKGLIEVKKAKINNLQSQIADEQAAAAARQRRGLEVTQDSLNKIASLQKEIQSNQHDIEEILKDIDRHLNEFDEKIKRLEVITGQAASDYPAMLKAHHAPTQKDDTHKP
jgi:DNA repair exonuclease SbcCD ATPase subunit